MRRLDFRVRRLTASLRMLPDFLIIGAQKSGTTSLYNHLIQHPGVGTAFEKEVRYFNDHYEEGVNWYRAHFPLQMHANRMTRRHGSRYLTGEGEPSYLPNPKAPERVLDLVPDVKLIVMLRNPVDRAFSHYHHRFVRDREARSFEEVCNTDKETLKDGWDKMPTGDYIRLGHAHYSYLPRGFYYEQLKTWFGVFPREQFLLIRAEDFFAETQAIFDEVLDFLALPPHALEQRKKHNVGKYSATLSDAMRQDLSNYFRPHNQQLYDFIGRDLSWDTGR